MIKGVISMIKWKEKNIQKPVISNVQQSKEDNLEVFLLLPVSFNFIYMDLNPSHQSFFTDKLSIAKKDQPIIDLLNYYILEVEQDKDFLSHKLTEQENKIEGAVSKNELENLLFVSRDCHYLKESLNNLSRIIDYIETKTEFLQDYESLNFDITISQLVYELVNIQAQVLTLTEVSDLIYSHRQNSHIKRLTIFALVFSIPTFITSFYGMNVDLPFQKSPFLLLILIGVNAVVTAILLFIIKHFN